jgi:hypothetical protein
MRSKKYPEYPILDRNEMPGEPVMNQFNQDLFRMPMRIMTDPFDLVASAVIAARE